VEQHCAGLFNASGAATHTYSYGTFGEPQGASGSSGQPLRFAARELDATAGLYYVRARWYDAGMGRFISEDPIGLAGGINNYAYAANDPVNLRDPTGLCPPSICLPPVVVTGRARTSHWADGFLTSGIDESFSLFGGQDGSPHHRMFGTAEMALRPCGGNGFSAERCQLLNEAIDRLGEHPIEFCRMMGGNARNRLDNWNYRYDPHFPIFGYMRRGEPYVVIGPISYAPIMAGYQSIELQNTVAHEEGHHVGLFHNEDQRHLPFPVAALPSANAVGVTCREGEGLIRR
jgi:RHS repeat-associated protein